MPAGCHSGFFGGRLAALPRAAFHAGNLDDFGFTRRGNGGSGHPAEQAVLYRPPPLTGILPHVVKNPHSPAVEGNGPPCDGRHEHDASLRGIRHGSDGHGRERRFWWQTPEYGIRRGIQIGPKRYAASGRRGNRTLTPLAGYRILSPVRLPVSPSGPGSGTTKYHVREGIIQPAGLMVSGAGGKRCVNRVAPRSGQGTGGWWVVRFCRVAAVLAPPQRGAGV